ncbi:hypothetical protein Tco_1484494 [Tanacetum coccineum]
MNWGEVNPVHAYYNGSCTSKDNEDPSWSTSFKTRRTSKTSSALEALWKTLFMLYLYKIGTLSMVIQKRVEDLQLGVKSYEKKINVTKPETTKLSIRKKDPYTLYQDPQRFIYVDNQRRNRLMRSDELYKFSDGTLTRL